MKFHIKTFGCRLNQAESATWQYSLTSAGWEFTDTAKQADIVIVHSCAVTAKAESESLHLLRKLKADFPTAKIVLTGCAAELSLPNADLIVRKEDKNNLAKILLNKFGYGEKTEVPLFKTARASIKIQDGCDAFCSYCIVPYTRGKPQNAPFSQILDSAKKCIDEGFCELVITGCHIAKYSSDNKNLLNLLAELLKIKGNFRLRLGSIEPCVIDDISLLQMIAGSNGKICKFLHFPIQSASDNILGKMNRTYSRRDVEKLTEAVHEFLPDAAFGADIIAGFPGETEMEFAETLNWIKSSKLNAVHVFPYSKRPGTPAANFPNQIPKNITAERCAKISESVKLQKQSFIADLLNIEQTVLVEKQISGIATGWNEQHILCHVNQDLTPRHKLTKFIPTKQIGETLEN